MEYFATFEHWPFVLAVITISASATTAIHILLRKEDPRAATGWLGLVWFTPIFGVCLYWLFGINRIKRKASLLFSHRSPIKLPDRRYAVGPEEVALKLFSGGEHLSTLAKLTENSTKQPLMSGNKISPIKNGDDAYPAMLSSISSAKKSVVLCTYIFSNDRWGKKFSSELRAAVERGVKVRVLIDAIGARYSFPPVVWVLNKYGIPNSRFMKSLNPFRFRYYNLRNHRKILVVDGKTGFTGGMNISGGNVLNENPKHPVQDIHFKIEGPVVSELVQAFADDWEFTTKERLEGDFWFPKLSEKGNAIARGISDGPDENFDKLRMVMLGALSCARTSVKITSPYFLPDIDLVTSLKLAVLRGVRVDIILPEKNNLRAVHWASSSGLTELSRSGCNIYYFPPPFDHSKLMIVDNMWSLIGSANWDDRSLKLNFEFNIECYDPILASDLNKIIEFKASNSIKINADDLDKGPFLKHLRGRIARLFTPYL